MHHELNSNMSLQLQWLHFPPHEGSTAPVAASNTHTSENILFSKNLASAGWVGDLKTQQGGGAEVPWAEHPPSKERGVTRSAASLSSTGNQYELR